MILFRYIAKEVYGTLLASTAVLLLLVTSHQVVHYLTQAAAGIMPLHTVLHIVSLQMPLLLGLLLPLGLYLGILITYSRLYSDREMIILFSCGWSKAQLIGMTLIFSTLLAIVVGIITLWFQPAMESYKQKILLDAATSSPLERITPDQFVPLKEGGLVLYTQGLSRDHRRLQDIFVARRPTQSTPGNAPSWDIVVANNGHQMIDPATRDRFLVLEEGARYVGIPGAADFQKVQYKSYGVRIQKNAIPADNRPDTMPTLEVWKHQHGNPELHAELQWRLALPISVWILSLLAIPLSQVDPRQGRYGQLLPAFLFYILYVDLLFVSRAWLKRDQISSGMGLWWVHALMVCIAAILVIRFMGWRFKKAPI